MNHMTKCPECYSLGKHAAGCSHGTPPVGLDDTKPRSLVANVEKATKVLNDAGIDFTRRGGVSRFYTK